MPENKEGQEKTEQPTGKRKEKSRQEGQVAKSQEINYVAGLFASLLYFTFSGPSMVRGLYRMVRRFLADISDVTINSEFVIELLGKTINDFFALMLPFFALLVVVAILSNIFQIGPLFTMKPLQPDINKLDPVSGFKRIISFQKLFELAKNVLKLLIIGIIPCIVLLAEVDEIPLIMDAEIWSIMGYIGSVIIKIIFYVTLVMVLLAIIDFIYQRWTNTRKMMMTKQEVKDERRQAEGDPKVKARIRQLQFRMALKRMMQDVPTADVVVTNPVHLAVALKYDRTKADAPLVVAKGARLIAEKIKQVAREHNVPLVENKPLAQTLYKMVDVGDIIPESLYRTVAEVLAYVYTQKNRRPSASGF